MENGYMFRDYRIKVYLNARHFIFIDGQQGATHPHTWEFSVDIRFPVSEFIEFTDFEVAFSKFLSVYQNQVMNEIEPFNTIIPTVENIADYFSVEFSKIIADMGGTMLRLVASETPTRSYMITAQDNIVLHEKNVSYEEECRKEIVNKTLDRILLRRIGYANKKNNEFIDDCGNWR